MGDAQSAQRDGKEDEESVPADDAHGDQTTTDKALPNNGKISGLSGKTDDPIAEVNGHNEEEVVAEVCDTTSAVASPKEDVPDIEEPLKDEEAPLENVELNEKESPDADKAALPNETEAKMNEINDGFKKFFSNIGLKLTVKRGSTEKPEVASDAPVDTKEGEPSSPDDVKETTKETTSENAEHTVDLNTAQETPDNDSTTCPTMTDMTLEDIQENAEEKTTETTEVNEEVTSDKVEALTTTAVAEEGATPGEDTAPNKEPEDTSPTSPDEEEVMSPIKKFFTKGIFSGLRKKKKPVEEEKAKDETLEKELVDMRTNENAAKTEEAGQDQEQVKEEVSSGVETAAVEQDQKEHELKEEITPAASDTALTTNAPEIGENDNTVNEQELLSSQERVKVQGSPLKRLLSGSSLKKLSKKQRGRKSSEPKLTDSGEHVSDQLLSSTESAEHRREKSPAGSPEEVAQAEDGTWASFKKLVTPKKAVKRSSLGNEEAVISGTLEEPKPNEGEQISDDSTEETKKRKDSSVSWEAFLCGSGSRRSRKTSDSDGETPQNEGDDNRPEGESRHAAESPLERSHEGHEHIASSPEQPGSLSDGEGGSAWKSIKKLVTPKRKAKEEEESKDRIPSDCEMSKDESSFSIKKLLPGRKKRKSAEKQEQLSSDEAERGVGSEDEDSETPAVVPLSEFDTFETEDQIQTQVVIESHIHQAEDYEPQQDLSVQPTEPALPSDPEPEKVQDNDNALENEASTIPASNEEADELTEVISKHQQLSDIPEEGIIEESMATPASVAEEATRDDTIAEDLIELTSEAVTAPEPVDITLADETEMVSAVSQLTESSKTSGNTTPVPAEYDVKETEDLLHQVVETIGVSVCENDPSLERIVGSVSPDILKTSVEREAVILETDATALCTGLSTEEFDAINKIASQTECVSEVTETISTELVSEDTTEEFDTAGITVDEVHYAGVSQAQESVKESESIDESQLQVECVSGVIGSATTEVSLGDEEVDTAQVSVDGGEQDEAQPAEMASQESDSAPVEDEDQTAKTGETLQTSIPVEAAALDSEEGSAHVPESKVITEGTEADDAMDSVTDEPIQETQEVGVDGDEDKPLDVEIDAAEVEHAPANAELENQNISEDILAPSADDAISSFTDKMDEAPQDVVAEDEAPRDVVAEDEAPRDVVAEDEDKLSEVVDELPALTSVHVASVDSEGSSVQVLEKQVISEDIQGPDAENATDSVIGEVESETLLVTEQVLVEKEHTTIENDPNEVPRHILAVDEGQISEVTNELQALTAVHLASLTSEASGAQTLEKSVISEDMPLPETEDAIVPVTDEPTQEVHITEVNVEEEKELNLPGVEMETADVEHAPVMQEITCSVGLHDPVLASVPDAAIVETSDIPEPLIDVVTTEVESQEAVESLMTLTATVKDDMIATAEEGYVVPMMHIPSVQLEDNHSIQVQVVDVSVDSANIIVETLPEVGVADSTEVIDVCDKMDNEEEPLSAALETEEEMIDEANKVITHSVTQYQKENLPEVLPQLVVESCLQNEPVTFEQGTTVELEQSEMLDRKLGEVEVQQIIEDSSEVVIERPAESLAVEDVSVHRHKEVLEKTTVELKMQPDAPEDSTCSSEAVVVRKLKEDNAEVQIPQTNSCLVVPQNTGLISSIGNVESPSSLSLEFKLNIQFGQAKAPPPPLPLIGKIEGLKQTEVSDVGVQATEKTETKQKSAETLKQPAPLETGVQVTQAAEPVQQITASEISVSHNDLELSEVAFQVTEIVASATQLDSTERDVILNKPAELQVGTQPTEMAEITPIEKAVVYSQPVLSDIGALVAGTVQPVMQMEATESTVIASQTVVSEVCAQETGAIKPVQIEEEYDQDVWLDAEEDISAQGGTGRSCIKAGESLESEKENSQGEERIVDDDTAQRSQTEGDKSHEEIPKTGTISDVECEGDDFAIALEQPEPETAMETSVPTLEWD